MPLIRLTQVYYIRLQQKVHVVNENFINVISTSNLERIAKVNVAAVVYSSLMFMQETHFASNLFQLTKHNITSKLKPN